MTVIETSSELESRAPCSVCAVIGRLELVAADCDPGREDHHTGEGADRISPIHKVLLDNPAVKKAQYSPGFLRSRLML